MTTERNEGGVPPQALTSDNEVWRLALDSARDLEGCVGLDAVQELLVGRFVAAIRTGEQRVRSAVLAELRGVVGVLDECAPERRARERG